MDSIIAASLGEDDPLEIGRFTIIGLLGTGGMAEVYLGVNEDSYVAVKRVRPRLVSRERFAREVAILHRVPPGIAPRVLANDSTPVRPWFATEYVPGLTVDEAVRLHGPLPAGVLRLLLAETAAALATVHAAGIVHRDLKPANLMLVRDGVQLIDFGIARAAGLPRLTRNGGGYGTHGFTAPEQEAGDRDVAAPADVYSLGALLLYAASGRTPGAVADVGPVRGADAELAAVIESCLDADPGARPSAAQLVTSAHRLAPGDDLSWPDELTARIEARRRFAATPVTKVETLPPPGSGTGSGGQASTGSGGRQGATSRPRPSVSDEAWLLPAAGNLAARVRTQWEREERMRRVHDPYPLPVGFEVAPPDLFDHWANIRRAGPGTAAGSIALAGELDEITAVYRSVPSERLVVLGQAGSGKTILALRFVLDRLSKHSPDDRVPVIFSLGSWNPAAISLRDWMCRRLVRDYNTLEAKAPAASGNMAAALIDNHYILPVFDGFDEIASGLQSTALAALNQYPGPLLLTSRPAEYARAVRESGRALAAAACIELKSLTLADVDQYLTRASRPGIDPAPRTAWEPALSQLRVRPNTHGAANVADALTTPLMVALARTVYSDAPRNDPAELLATDQFPTAGAVREHLLAEFVPAAYRQLPADHEAVTAPGRRPRRWNDEHAKRWLGYLAWQMEERGRPDLAWWELGTVLGQRAIMLLVGVTVGVAAALVAGLVYGSAAALHSGLASGLRAAAVTAPANGVGVGLTFGVMYGFASHMKVGGPVFEPSYMRLRLHAGVREKLQGGFLWRVWGGLAGGLLFASIWAIGDASYSAAFQHLAGSVIEVHAETQLALGAGLGAVIGLVAALGICLEDVSEKEKAAHPSALLAKNRFNVLAQLVMVGILTGIAAGVALGPAIGLAAGLMIALGLGTMTAWGRWVVLARIWLPLRGQLPWAVAAFLDDAHYRGVLRQAGTVYQFRHARIQTQLAEKFAHRVP